MARIKDRGMIIFSPGPANISDRVRRALTLPDICHRDTEFKELLTETRRLILKVCGAVNDYAAIVFTGSGTAAIEASISSLVGVYESLLVISNGVYGERASDIAELHNINNIRLSFPTNQLPDLEKIKQAIESQDVDAVYVVHHETTTGLLNPLKEIASYAKQYNKPILVDGVSSICGEELDLKGWGIDLIIGSVNKCIRGVPGLSFVVASKNLLGQLKRRQRSSYYLDLMTHLEKEDKGETPFTPAVQSFYALREALYETLDEAVDHRIQHYKNISRQLRDGLRELGFRLYLPDEISANTMTTVYLPKKMTYELLHKRCKEGGFVIYSCPGELKGKAFRLGIVGCITYQDIDRFLDSLNAVLRDVG
jgi:2-aminoethylphosphonate-pyruvate transaminase